jgi:hypothetical protein
MRKIMSFGIAAVLVVVAGTWAAGTTGQNRDGATGTRINTLELMMNSKNLPTQPQYEAF